MSDAICTRCERLKVPQSEAAKHAAHEPCDVCAAWCWSMQDCEVATAMLPVRLRAQLHEERTVARGIATALHMALGGTEDDDATIDAIIAEARENVRAAIAALKGGG